MPSAICRDRVSLESSIDLGQSSGFNRQARPERLSDVECQGCCLCEGLEHRLRNLPLHQLKPPLVLRVVDIDSSGIPKNLRDIYDLHVPVMCLGKNGLNESFELPRVSPRLDGEGLFKWLQKTLTKTAGSGF